MNLLRLGAAAVNQTPLDWEGNLHRINVVLEEAYAAEVGLLCLPELCLTGYGCEDMYFAPGVHLAALRSLVTLAEETRKLAFKGLDLTHLHVGHSGTRACLEAAD